MADQQPEKRVDHGEVHRREQTSTESVGPGSSSAKPILIAGYVVAALAILWAIFFSGFVV